MDSDNAVFEKGSLGITGDFLSYVGESTEEMGGKEIIDAKGGIVLPGLINGHTHAAMTLFRGLADDLPLMEWLNHYIFPAESRIDSHFVYMGTLLACAEMIMSGTTTFCDMYLFEGDAARAAKEAGIRCLVGEVLYDFDSPNYGSVANGLKYTERLIETWQDDPLVSVAVEPHALFTCSPSLLTAAHELALKYDVPLIIHLSETENEVTQVMGKYGKRPVDHLRFLGLLGPKLIADHCVHLNEYEMNLLSENRVKIIHNPESNMKLASGIAPVPRMLKMGITVGLGTDGSASNNDLDLFTEMDTAAKLQKIHTGDTTVMDALTVLRMATADGAKALGMDEIIGSLEKGKKADVIIVETDRAHLTPMYNPYSHLVYSAKGSDVSHTIINGKPIMVERALLSLDLGELLEECNNKSKEILKWLRVM